MRGFRIWAAGLFVLAALCLPARAEPSVISFVSGPLAGAPASNVEREDDNNLAERGTMVSESAVFRAGGMIAFVKWSRLSGNYVWQDRGLNALTDSVRKAMKSTFATVVSGDRATISGFKAQYRDVRLDGTPQRCGVFELQRGRNDIIGFACRADGQPVPIVAILEGLSVEHVISP